MKINAQKIDSYITTSLKDQVKIPFLMKLQRKEDIQSVKGLCDISSQIGCIVACTATYSQILELAELDCVLSIEASR